MTATGRFSLFREDRVGVAKLGGSDVLLSGGSVVKGMDGTWVTSGPNAFFASVGVVGDFDEEEDDSE